MYLANINNKSLSLMIHGGYMNVAIIADKKIHNPLITNKITIERV